MGTMSFSDIYGGTTNPSASPNSGQPTSPVSSAKANASPAPAIAYVGMIAALVILRVIYELS